MTTTGNIKSLQYVFDTTNEGKRATFRFSGDISLEQANTLVDNFRTVSETLSTQAAPVALVANRVAPVVENKVPVTRVAPVENKVQVTPVNIRPPEVKFVNQRPISVMQLHNYKELLVTNIRNFLQLTVQGSTNNYKVMFPRIRDGFPAISMRNNRSLPPLLMGNSYPVCSCPSYYYKGYRQGKGGCKHIHGIFEVAGIDFTHINWDTRPDDLPVLLYNEGHQEYRY